MGKILLIEDSSSIILEVEEWLDKRGCEVVNAYSYASAIRLWNKYHGEFDCIILDLHIDPSGLDRDRHEKYFPLVGMAVLDFFCRRENDMNKYRDDDEQKRIWGKTIIFSGYTDILRSRRFEFPYFNLLKIVPKSYHVSTQFRVLEREIRKIMPISMPA